MPSGDYSKTKEFKEHVGKKISARLKGKPSNFKGKKHSKKTIIRIIESRKGYKHSEETRKKISITKGSIRNWVTPLTKRIRKCFEYRQWRSDVYERDNYICQKCDKKGGILNAHHIKPFSLILKENNINSFEEALFCDELWNINNGLTLCEQCHKKTTYTRFKKQGLI